MRKITLKISAFLLFAMVALQAQAQTFTSEIVAGTKYNFLNVGTGNYLRGTGITSLYETTDALVDGDVNFNFYFNHHDSTDKGADGELGTEDDVVHNYTDDWNLQNDAYNLTKDNGSILGIMRDAGTKYVHTSFKYNQSFNANGGHKTDKRFVATAVDLGGGLTAFKISSLSSGETPRFIYDDGSAPIPTTDENMAEGTESNALWLLAPATNTLSTQRFGVNAFSISNPVNHRLTVKGATSKVKEISLYSVLGNKVLSRSLYDVKGDIKLNVSSLSTGLYIVKMTGKNGERFTKKIIKQ